MSTRAKIMIVDSNNIVTGIYCHFDGYLDGVGATLLKHYSDLDKVKDLIALGSISYLEKSIECPLGHSFNTPIKGYTVAYHRDRGEDFCQSRGVIENGIIKNIAFEPSSTDPTLYPKFGVQSGIVVSRSSLYLPALGRQGRSLK